MNQESTQNPTWTKYGSKMVQKGPRNGPKRTKKWSKKDQEMVQKGPRNGLKTTKKWSKKDQEMVLYFSCLEFLQ